MVCLALYGEGSHKKLEKFKFSKSLKGPEPACMVGQSNVVEIDSVDSEPPLPIACKHVILVTCGLERTDYSDKSRRRYQGLTQLLKDIKSSYQFTLSNRDHKEALQRSLKSNFAFLEKAKEEEDDFLLTVAR